MSNHTYFFDKEKVKSEFIIWKKKYDEKLKQPEVVAEIARLDTGKKPNLELRDYKLKIRPRIPNIIAQSFIDIPASIACKDRFNRYNDEWKEGMMAAAMDSLILYFHGYDYTKGTSIFSYFITIAERAFFIYLRDRKKDLDIDTRARIEATPDEIDKHGSYNIGDTEESVYDLSPNPDDLNTIEYAESLPDDIIYKIHELRGEGCSYDTIIERLNLKKKIKWRNTMSKILTGELFYYVFDDLGKPTYKKPRKTTEGWDAYKAKISNEDLPKLYEAADKGVSDAELAAKFGISEGTVWNIRRGHSRKDEYRKYYGGQKLF